MPAHAVTDNATPSRESSFRPSRLNGAQDDFINDGTPEEVQSAPDGGPAPLAGRKRKATSAASRGVANLTPEQLAKKRANDREAQRAIRERTKAQIEALQQQVRDLSSQKPYLDLQAALKEKEAVEAENREIKKRLADVLDIIQPLLRTSGTSGNSSVRLIPVYWLTGALLCREQIPFQPSLSRISALRTSLTRHQIVTAAHRVV